LDTKRKAPEAIAKFEEIKRRYGKSPVIDEVKLALARLYEEQNKPAQALELYDEIVAANQFGGQFTGLGSEAGLRKEDLLAQHPELRKVTPPPTIQPTPQPLPPMPVLVNTNPEAPVPTPRPMPTNVIRLT